MGLEIPVMARTLLGLWQQRSKTPLNGCINKLENIYYQTSNYTFVCQCHKRNLGKHKSGWLSRLSRPSECCSARKRWLKNRINHYCSSTRDVGVSNVSKRIEGVSMPSRLGNSLKEELTNTVSFLLIPMGL